MLRPLLEIDATLMLEWMHDPDINCWFQINFAEYTEQQAVDFIRKANEDNGDRTQYHYAITEDDGEYLGTISLKNVDKLNRNAEYAICMRKAGMGKGMAFQATQDILEIAFDELKLNRVYLNVLSGNKKAIALYERSNFRYEGEWKEHIFLNNQYCSLKWYGMQREEWLNGKNNA